MVGRSAAPTKAEKRRMEAIKSLVGCVACRLEGRPYTPCDIHHAIAGGRRSGHSATVGLCPAHHRIEHASAVAGPNLKREPVEFREAYGTDEELVALTDEYLDWFSARTVGGS